MASSSQCTFVQLFNLLNLVSHIDRPITKSDPVLTTTLLNVLMVSRGLGSTLSTPITTALIRDTRDQRHSWKVGFQVDGGRYEQMIVYVGSCFAAAAAVSTFGWATQRHK
jgi:MCP family monocarboxylic acid transporter-like MFS transporter 10